jgi:predicted metalloprotease
MCAQTRPPDLKADVRCRRRFVAVALFTVLASGGIALPACFQAARAQTEGPAGRNQTRGVSANAVAAGTRQGDQLRDFVASILGDTEDVWREQFQLMKQSYKEPRLVLFRGQTQSACGKVTSAVGPTYCPADEKIYLDLAFFLELKDRYRADADFARAYVIAHEVGHHIQKLLEIPEKALKNQPEMNREQKEQLAIRLELQADYLAGVWAHHADKARHILEPGDVEAALALLAAIGDDRIKRENNGDFDARSLTRCWDRRHGNGAQKIQSFKKGLETGDVAHVYSINSAK